MTKKDPSRAAPPLSPDTAAGDGVELSDRFLLKKYVNGRDETAFAALVHRYAPLVLGVCRRVLAHEQDAEDAFQATFLVLARKAGTISKSGSMGGWLYRVAYRIARKLKGRQARRRGRERAMQEVTAEDETPEWVWRDLGVILDEEVNRLPHKYRLPFVLCYLDGKSNEEAAARLACPVGTLASRLAWARERLRARLTRRGVTVSTGLLAATLAAHAGRAAVPAALAETTIVNGLRFGAGQAASAGAVSARLAREYLRNVLRRKLLLSAAALGVAIALWWLLRPGGNGAGPLPARQAASPQEEVKRLQGPWQIAELQFGGQQVDPQGTRMVFTGRTVRLEGGGQPFLMTFEVDPSREPKTIDLVLLSAGSIPAPGIYEWTSDGLRLCYSTGGPPRPTEFITRPDTTRVLYVLRRE